jgi:threonine dehydrogenase-like Zn-dependent dehydrogenase
MTGDAPFTFPVGPIGHEFAGEIVEVGRNVASTMLGQNVACLLVTPCGKCEGCRTGNPIFCHAPNRGPGNSGGFGEYAAVPADGAIALPGSLSLADGALVEPMACGLHALRMARMEGGERILVLGAGSMALSLIYWARRLGAGKIVVVSRSAHRSDLARLMGADDFFCTAEAEPALLNEALGGAADIVAECAGKTGMLGEALAHVRPQGTIISMGMCMHNEPLLAAACTFKEARLLFPLGYSYDEFVETARAFESDSIHAHRMVSDVIALEELPATLDQLRAGSGQRLKIQVDPQKGLVS